MGAKIDRLGRVPTSRQAKFNESSFWQAGLVPENAVSARKLPSPAPPVINTGLEDSGGAPSITCPHLPLRFGHSAAFQAGQRVPGPLLPKRNGTKS